MKILILGSSGILGTSMEDVCKEKEINYSAVSHNDIEITNFKASDILKYGCGVVLNGVGMMGVNFCEEDPFKAFAINSASISKLAKICQENNLLLIQPSTHAVFGGTKATLCDEESIPNPTSIYGISRYASEFIVKSTCDQHYILRFPPLFGRRRNNGTGFIDKLPQLLKDGKDLKVSADNQDSFTYSKDLSKKIIMLLHEREPCGVYHIANDGFPTYYEFACRMRDLYGLRNKIEKVSDMGFKSKASKPLNAKMSSIKIPLLRSWDEALEEFTQEK